MSMLGVYLAELRAYHKLTLNELAERVGVTDRLISAWEKGRHQPAVDKLSALVTELGGSITDVARLVKNDATADEAKMMACLRFKSPQALTDEEVALFEALSPAKRQAILTLIRGQ